MAIPKVSKMQSRINMSVQERKTRDEEVAFEKAMSMSLPDNTFWDSANELFATSMLGLEKTHSVLIDGLTAVLTDPEQRDKITDLKGLTANVNLLTKDIGTHMELLNSIYADHKDKTGGTTTPDEHMEVITINGRYYDAIELYNTNIMPTVSHVLEQANLLDVLVDAVSVEQFTQEQADLTDPNVISDVQVKDATVQTLTSPEATPQQHTNLTQGFIA